MDMFSNCSVGDKVKRSDGHVGEIVAVTAKRFRAQFKWPEPITVWHGSVPVQATHFFDEFRKSDGRNIGNRKSIKWAQHAT